MSVTSRTQIETWFIQSYQQLTEAAYRTHPDLFVNDAHRILSEVADEIPTFQGESRDDFLQWAEHLLLSRVREIQRTERILAKCRRYIRGAIHRYWPTHTLDHSADAEDFYSELASLVHEYADKLDQPGKAKLTTRVFGLAKKHMRNVNTKRNRRLVLIARHVAAGGEVVGAIPPEQLAAERYSEANATLYTH